jgi:hypothetical protein
MIVRLRGELQVGIGWGGPRSFSLVGLPDKVEEQARGRRCAAGVQAALWLAANQQSKVANSFLARCPAMPRGVAGALQIVLIIIFAIVFLSSLSIPSKEKTESAFVLHM